MRRQPIPVLRLFCLCLLLSLAQGAWAQLLRIGELAEDQHAGRYSEYLQEQAEALHLEQAIALFQQGHGRPGEQQILNFGIGSRPTWLHLRLNNPTDQPISARVTTGISWVDELQLSLLQGGKVLEQWEGGDTVAGARGLVPGIGYVVTLRIPSGNSDLYLRAASPEPLVLPFQVLSEDTFNFRMLQYRFVYGLIYGFLLSMVVYNGMLFLGMRDRSYLYYSLNLGTFTLLNFAYSGHGFAWIWPDHPILQQHANLVSMVLFGCSGLAFVSSLLRAGKTTQRVLQGLSILGAAGFTLSLLLDMPLLEVLVAFGFSLTAVLSMFFLAAIALRLGTGGRYVLLALFCGVLGSMLTTLTVWGMLPFTTWSYAAIKIGIILQAILLALGLSYRFRLQQAAKQHAEHVAQRDPLTGLHNRRGFSEQAAPIWNNTLRHQRPLSLIMLDLDHFKTINDLHGHAAGDRALVQTAKLLAKSCRGADLLARWGGEEFLLLLPETGLDEAQALAERLRAEIQTLSGAGDLKKLALSASFGVIERSAQLQLEQLINQADRLLFVAKRSGRNRVCTEG